MLAELRLELETNNPDFGYYQSSNMQGILMEQIDTDYAQVLHEQGLKPYSQYVLGGDKKEWVVKTLTKEAYQEIIVPIMESDFTGFCLDKKKESVKIREKKLKTITQKQLLDEFYGENRNRYINIEFLTPTAFKSNGRYIIMPEIKYMFQSLMNKYSAASSEIDMFDEETLSQIAEDSSIVRYRLHSTTFPLEKVRIPSFKGEITIRVNGTDTMARYIRLLARFGEYSGIGIKTAIGMGGIQLKE